MDSDPPEIRVRVQSLGIADYEPFYVSPFITVEAFKKLVCEKNHFPLMTTRLLFKGKSLISTSTLFDYKISNNDIIYAVPASRVPPEYLPIWFTINVQSEEPQVFHYRTNERDYDRQLDSMRTKVGEIQELCSSALLRISLTQGLLERHDNPHSEKIKSAISPDDNPFQPPTPSQTASRNFKPPQLPMPTTYEEKLNRFKHGCRLVQGKLFELIKALKSNIENLRQYHLLTNGNGEMGADFVRVGEFPVPPPLTRNALITNVTHGLAELFGGTPEDNLIPHTVYNFPDGFPTESSLYNAERRRKAEPIETDSQHDETTTTEQQNNNTTNSEQNNQETTTEQQNATNTQQNSTTNNQHQTNSTEQQNITNTQQNVTTNNQHQTNANENIYNDPNMMTIDPYPYESNIQVPSSNDLFSPQLPGDLTNYLVQHSKDQLTQQTINIPQPTRPETNINPPRARRPARNSNRQNTGLNFPFNFLRGMNNLRPENREEDNRENEKKLSFEEFFTPEEIAQMERDHKIINEAERNGNIPDLESHYYQSRIVDGY